MQSISILVLCLIAHVSIEIPRCKWFSLGPTSKLLYFPSLPLLLYVPAWPLPILHMLEKQSCQLYCPTTSEWYCHQQSTHCKNPILWSIFLLFYSNIRAKCCIVCLYKCVFLLLVGLHALANVFQSDDCINNDKIDCSVKSLYYLIINHCTGLNWSDWRFKRSLKLLFTDDQLHTSLTDEILMKNWPKSNNATDPGVIYLKRCLPFTVALFNLTMILVQMM